MNSQGDYGFGHLRFQEYFAACELRANRNIRLVPMLYSEWWRGPLVLLAQMSDDIDFLFREAIDRSQLVQALPTLNAMLRGKSQNEVKRLDEWLVKFIHDEDEQTEAPPRDYFETNDREEEANDVQLQIRESLQHL